jgi:hypothetical protein
LFSVASDLLKRAHSRSRLPGIHPARRVLLCFLICQGCALGLLARACLAAAQRHPQGWQIVHGLGLALCLGLVCLTVRAWPAWWTAAGCQLISLPASSAHPTRIIMARPDGIRGQAVVRGHWAWGRWLFVMLAEPGGACLLLPHQAAEADGLSALRRAVRVARSVQPNRTLREHR